MYTFLLAWWQVDIDWNSKIPTRSLWVTWTSGTSPKVKCPFFFCLFFWVHWHSVCKVYLSHGTQKELCWSPSHHLVSIIKQRLEQLSKVLDTWNSFSAQKSITCQVTRPSEGLFSTLLLQKKKKFLSPGKHVGPGTPKLKSLSAMYPIYGNLVAPLPHKSLDWAINSGKW